MSQQCSYLRTKAGTPAKAETPVPGARPKRKAAPAKAEALVPAVHNDRPQEQSSSKSKVAPAIVKLLDLRLSKIVQLQRRVKFLTELIALQNRYIDLSVPGSDSDSLTESSAESHGQNTRSRSPRPQPRPRRPPPLPRPRGSIQCCLEPYPRLALADSEV